MLSIETSFLLASRSGPTHLHTQPLVKTHLAIAPDGPSCVMVPLKRWGVLRPPLTPLSELMSLRNDWRSFHSTELPEQKPCLSTMLGNLVRPISLRVVVLKPPSSSSTTADSDFSPLQLRNGSDSVSPNFLSIIRSTRK